MKTKKISREFLERYDQLLEKSIGADSVPLMHCRECKGEIELRTECTVSDDLTITICPGDYTEGQCSCSNWEVDNG